MKDTAAFNNVLHSDAFQEKRQQMRGLIDKMEGMDKSGEEYNTVKAEYDRIAAEMDGMRVNTPLNEDSTGMKLMGKANEMRQQATEGMSGVGAFAADAALSIGQTLAAVPTMVLGPAAPVAVLGTQAAAQKAYEVQKEGGGATEALGRGVLSGSIEAATEKIPLDNLWDLVKSGGKGVLRNLLKQAGVEATEEGLSYTANFIADKAAGDPNARFSVDELLRSAAAGGVSGLFFGGVGSFAHSQTQSGKPGNTSAQTKDSVVPRRRVGRAPVGTVEEFREAYLKKLSDANEIRKQYLKFKTFAKDFDVVETVNGPLTRSEVLKLLSGTKYTTRQINELFDRILDARVAKRGGSSADTRMNKQRSGEVASAASISTELNTGRARLYEAGSERKKSLRDENGSAQKLMIVEQIGRSVGAKAKNYKVYNPITGDDMPLTEGTRITQPKNHVMAGKGRERQIDELQPLLDRFGGDPLEWTKEKGFGYVDDEYGESHYVELHWYQEPSVGRHKMKIKIQTDGRIYLDED